MKTPFLAAFALLLTGTTSAAPPKIVRIVLERTPCYGTCPVYTLTLNADGTAVYKGTRFVSKLGTYKGTFWVGEFNRLQPLLEKWGVWAMKDRYTVPVTDQPTHLVTIVTDKGRKTVSEYGQSGPAELWALQTLLDGIAANVDWKKG